MSAYPENGLELYNKKDYWTCRDLLELASSGRINPEDKRQDAENQVFNAFLNKRAGRRYQWAYIPEPKTLRQIKDYGRQ